MVVQSVCVDAHVHISAEGSPNLPQKFGICPSLVTGYFDSLQSVRPSPAMRERSTVYRKTVYCEGANPM